MSTPGRSGGSDTAVAWAVPDAAALLEVNLELDTPGAKAAALGAGPWAMTGPVPVTPGRSPEKIETPELSMHRQ